MLTISLPATEESFTGWTAHAEVGAGGESGGEHDGRGESGGEHDGSEKSGGEHGGGENSGGTRITGTGTSPNHQWTTGRLAPISQWDNPTSIIPAPDDNAGKKRDQA